MLPLVVVNAKPSARVFKVAGRPWPSEKRRPEVG